MALIFALIYSYELYFSIGVDYKIKCKVDIKTIEIRA